MAYLVRSRARPYMMRDLGTGKMLNVTPEAWTKFDDVPDYILPYGNNEVVVYELEEGLMTPATKKDKKKKQVDD